MNRHYIGFALFSFIIMSSGFLALLFGDLPKIEQPKFDEVPRFESKVRCRKSSYRSDKKDAAMVRVYQAVLDESNNLLGTDLIVKRADDATENVFVALHFFTKDGGEARHLKTETVLVVPDFTYSDRATHPVLSSFAWLENLESHENLYIIAEATKYRKYPKTYVPSFDDEKAVAVLVKHN